MFTYLIRKNKKFLFSTLSRAMVFVVSLALVFAPSAGYTQGLNLPTPGTMVTLSPSYTPAIMQGITLYPNNPLQFDFIIDVGDDFLEGEELQKESKKLISYFMATLTVPEDEMWVNLSPYEKNRIVADGLGETLMGRDMLAQDYLLKQLTASMMYPENELGNEFWKRIYNKAQNKFGTTEIPTDTFNKIWIVPEEAVIYANGTNIFVADSHLKVMMEEDYLSLEHHDRGLDAYSDNMDITQEAKAIIKEVLLPEIEREVNKGKNFAPLRQMYHSMILATWYKNNLKESLLGKVYVNQNKIDGVDVEDKDIKNKIYNQYIEAFQKGVYNYIKEDYDAATQQIIPRKYFSGGVDVETLSASSSVEYQLQPEDQLSQRSSSPMVKVAARVDLDGSVSSPVALEPPKLTEEELTLLGDESTKQARNDDRIRNQVTVIMSTLDPAVHTGFAELTAEKVIEDLNSGATKFKGQEVHVLDGVGADAKAIGRIDRKIAEKYGLPHETANFVLTYNGKVIVQLRNKSNYDDHLAMGGGHLDVGQSHDEGMVKEAREEAGFESFTNKPIFAGIESYNHPEDTNVERRSWYIIPLTAKEYEQYQTQREEVSALKATMSRAEFKQHLFDIQAQGDGLGEVVGNYEFTFAQLENAQEGTNPDSPYTDQSNLFIEVEDTFAEETISVKAFFTPDSLHNLIKNNQAIWQRMQNAVSSSPLNLVTHDIAKKELTMLPQLEAAIRELEKIDLSKGGLALDIDKTLLYKKEAIAKIAAALGVSKDELEEFQVQKVAELLGKLMSKTKIAIVSGNDVGVQWERLGTAIEDYLRKQGNLNTIQNFRIYGNGGATKLTFHIEGDEVIHENHPEYDQVFNFEEEELSSIEKFMNQLANSGELLRLYKEAIEEEIGQEISDQEVVNTLERKFKEEELNPKRKVDKFNYNWIYGQPWTIDRENSSTLSRTRTIPWEEERGLGDTVVQVSLKVIPSELIVQIDGEDREINIEMGLRHKMIDLMEAQDLLPNKYALRPGGTGSIDIGASKNRPLEDFVSEDGIQRKNVVYIADEFGKRKNDTASLEVEGITVITVGGTVVMDDFKADRFLVAGNLPDYSWQILDHLERAASPVIIQPGQAPLAGSSPAAQEYGGIDFNANNLNFNERGRVINMKFTDFPNIQPNSVNRVTPVIINITPIVNFPLLLSRSDLPRPEELSYSVN